MFQIERLQKIRQLIKEQKSVDVIWLSNYLRVSEVTIRRDLEKLETEGILKRTYGGAVLNEEYSSQEGQQEKHEEAPGQTITEQNRAMGEISASIVQDYDIVFLDSCGSNLVLAQKLSSKKGVVVLTNSLAVLSEMQKHQSNKVILTGGGVDYSRNIMCNSNSGIPFPDIRVNKAFIHIPGVDLDYGLAVNDSEDAFIYKQLKEKSKSIAAIMEKSVFDKVGLIRVDEIDSMDYVIADEGIPDRYKRFFYQKGIEIHQKFDL